MANNHLVDKIKALDGTARRAMVSELARNFPRDEFQNFASEVLTTAFDSRPSGSKKEVVTRAVGSLPDDLRKEAVNKVVDRSLTI